MLRRRKKMIGTAPSVRPMTRREKKMIGTAPSVRPKTQRELEIEEGIRTGDYHLIMGLPKPQERTYSTITGGAITADKIGNGSIT